MCALLRNLHKRKGLNKKNTYSIMNKVILESYILQDPFFLKFYTDQGFSYLRKVHTPYFKILREPTVGCIVELLYVQEPGAVEIKSPRGRHIIRSNCYF
jgi:hypothetical protein